MGERSRINTNKTKEEKHYGNSELDRCGRTGRPAGRDDYGRKARADRQNYIGKIIIGIIGANIGGYIASRFNLGSVDGINLTSILIAAGGACLLLAVLRLLGGKKNREG